MRRSIRMCVLKWTCWYCIFRLLIEFKIWVPLSTAFSIPDTLSVWLNRHHLDAIGTGYRNGKAIFCICPWMDRCVMWWTTMQWALDIHYISWNMCRVLLCFALVMLWLVLDSCDSFTLTMGLYSIRRYRLIGIGFPTIPSYVYNRISYTH